MDTKERLSIIPYPTVYLFQLGYHTTELNVKPKTNSIKVKHLSFIKSVYILSRPNT